MGLPLRAAISAIGRRRSKTDRPRVALAQTPGPAPQLLAASSSDSYGQHYAARRGLQLADPPPLARPPRQPLNRNCADVSPFVPGEQTHRTGLVSLMRPRCHGLFTVQACGPALFQPLGAPAAATAATPACATCSAAAWSPHQPPAAEVSRGRGLPRKLRCLGWGPRLLPPVGAIVAASRAHRLFSP